MWAMVMVEKPRFDGQPIQSLRVMNSSSSERPVITSGITSGALSMPPNSVRPRNRPNRTMAIPARVPSIVAKVAFTTAIRRLSQTAAQTSSLRNSSAYQRSDQPPHTGTSLEWLNE